MRKWSFRVLALLLTTAMFAVASQAVHAQDTPPDEEPAEAEQSFQVFVPIVESVQIVNVNEPSNAVQNEEVATSDDSEPSFEEQAAGMQAMYPYITLDENKIGTVDVEAARQDGFSEEAIQLAVELIQFQNEIVRAANQGDDASVHAASENYPRVNEFFQRATEYHEGDEKNEVNAASANAGSPCGYYDRPVPSSTPPRPRYPSSDPHQSLRSQNFHNTVSYACNQPPDVYSCETDYTRGRGYTGPYGYCPSPIFRDHGRVENSSTYSKQLGEPNPEIHSYVWPFLDWGAYAAWWHWRF